MNKQFDVKQKYREFCTTESDIPLFNRDWWLDAVCGETNWQVAIILKNGKIQAAWPYMLKKKLWFSFISMPNLSQTMGPYIKYPENQKYERKISFEREIYSKLIAELPKFDKFYQHFHYTTKNWLPFFWEGFSQTTRYTYVVEDISDPEKVWSEFNNNTRTEIRKAQKNVQIELSDDIELFYAINCMTFKRQNIAVPYTIEFLKKVDSYCLDHDARRIFIAKDQAGEIHAAIYVVWDSNCAYYLLSGGDPKLRNSGATSLLLWEAIKYFSSKTLKFDFEGSMIRSIEKVFSSFGGIQKPYFSITKINSMILKLMSMLKA